MNGSRTAKRPKKLAISATTTARGIDIIVNHDHFPIQYPPAVWRLFPKYQKEILKDNMAYATTIFLPQMFDLKEIHYTTARPLSETYLYENGIYDMPVCALTDGTSSLQYIKKFFNSQFLFADNAIKSVPQINLAPIKKIRPLILLSLGKESLLSFALCRELGVDPVLMTVVEPSNTYEFSHKQKLIAAFEKEFGVRVNVINYAPGFFRYGRQWQLNTELGWGLHLTEYCMLATPILHQSNANTIIAGNERSCDDILWDKEDVLTYEAGYDQHTHWVPQQAMLTSLLLGRRVAVTSLMEPIHEIMEMFILHSRYPEVGKYQMSCFSDNAYGKQNRWCQHCVKCGYTFALAAAFGIDTRQLGFTENLFDTEHAELFDHFFKFDSGAVQFGSFGELNIAFYRAYKLGYRGASIDRFTKKMLKPFLKNKRAYEREYLTIHPIKNIPQPIRQRIHAIYQDQLRRLPKL